MRVRRKESCAASLLAYTVFLFDALACNAMSDKIFDFRASHLFIDQLLLVNGDNEIRTRDLLLARQALSQLSYTPVCNFIFCKVIFPRSEKTFLSMGLSDFSPKRKAFLRWA